MNKISLIKFVFLFYLLNNYPLSDAHSFPDVYKKIYDFVRSSFSKSESNNYALIAVSEFTENCWIPSHKFPDGYFEGSKNYLTIIIIVITP